MALAQVVPPSRSIGLGWRAETPTGTRLKSGSREGFESIVLLSAPQRPGIVDLASTYVGSRIDVSASSQDFTCDPLPPTTRAHLPSRSSSRPVDPLLFPPTLFPKRGRVILSPTSAGVGAGTGAGAEAHPKADTEIHS